MNNRTRFDLKKKYRRRQTNNLHAAFNSKLIIKRFIKNVITRTDGMYSTGGIFLTMHCYVYSIIIKANKMHIYFTPRFIIRLMVIANRTLIPQLVAVFSLVN